MPKSNPQYNRQLLPPLFPLSVFVDACAAAAAVIPVRRPRRPFTTPVVVVVDTRDTRSIRRVMSFCCVQLRWSSESRSHALADDDGFDPVVVVVDRVDECASSSSFVLSTIDAPATRCVVFVVSKATECTQWFG